MTEENEKLQESTILAGVGSPAFPAGEGGAAVPEEVPAPAPDESFRPEEESPETVKLRDELAAVKGQLLRMEHERYLLSRGVPEEDLDYYAFKIEHTEGAEADFRKAAREYLKAHPIRRTAVSSGAELGAATRKPASANDLMNQLLRSR